MRGTYDEWFGADAYDATYGYDEARLRQVEAPPEPPDFEGFWRDLHRRASDVDTAPKLAPTATVIEDNDGAPVDVYDVTFTSIGDVQIGGWVTLPADGVVEQAVVVGHGYGGRAEPDLAPVPPRSAAIFPVARGLPIRSLLNDVHDEASGHVLHGIDTRDTYIHGGCAADMWCAATALLSLLPTPPSRLGYYGGSFGGGIGALALPWDERFTAAALHVPSFGNHPLRLTLPCTGSGESVRTYVQSNPHVQDVLRYFDAATAARRITIPTLLAPALWDPAVPPPGQFAVCNAVPDAEIMVLSAGHAEYPSQEEELGAFHARVRGMFRA